MNIHLIMCMLTVLSKDGVIVQELLMKLEQSYN